MLSHALADSILIAAELRVKDNVVTANFSCYYTVFSLGVSSVM
jgi:hypothetical protein